jgi:hypothetical protein
MPGTHVPPQHPLVAEHVLKHTPQCVLFVLVSTHTLPHSTCPPGQLHDPPLHVAPTAHVRPHIPQLLVSLLRSASHPSAAMLLQLAKPELQLNPQVLPEHVRDALLRAGHETPQPPQLFTFELTVVSQPLPGMPSQLSKPMLHAKPQSPLVHVALALSTEAQMFPHIPQ